MNRDPIQLECVSEIAQEQRVGFDARRAPVRQRGVAGDRAGQVYRDRVRVWSQFREYVEPVRGAVGRVGNEQVNRHFRRPRLISYQIVHLRAVHIDCLAANSGPPRGALTPVGVLHYPRLRPSTGACANSPPRRAPALNDTNRLSQLARDLLLLARSVDDDTYIDARAEDARPRARCGRLPLPGDVSGLT